ncbi:arylsulfatase [Dyadobacter aurulentus]|uniref:arylsulfatase n=1 Tax=Dyadobacter sp. UC 10 TaxID=2605428 RepID=UPI0011F27499|nr:arylsulfatase [Dyadobacter sp. UC 10]KAA0992304.1 arylsulfatase [Dyadobacter sp. UC 10]
MKRRFKTGTCVSLYFFLLTWNTVLGQHSPTPAFEGKIGKTVETTTESAPKINPRAPAGAPNIVWIQIDDIGYGAISAFGGLIETPNIDRLAKQGLRYTNFHTTAFCAPTRAALLTGRNQHSVHFGFFASNSYNTPGYDGYLPFEKATVGEILRENGYNTFAVGKYHLTHPSDATQAGPFNRWPTGRGFDHYFGFAPEVAATDQWHPTLYRDTQREPEDPQGRHVTELLANEAIRYISGQKSAAPDKPFFLYFAPGAVHAPIQVSQEWINKYKGKFSAGWDKYKETVLKNQKALGVVPANIKPAPKNQGVKDWDALSGDEKRLFERYIEVYAAFVSHTDHEIGRIINHIEQIGQLDNTLVVVLVGDNGAEGAGREVGRFLANKPNETEQQTVARYVKNIDQLGTENSSVLYPDGWAAATNTPFRYYKSYGNFEGGTHDPLILFYPNKIKDKGGIRHQYSHVNDILPTTLELAGAKVPDVINGYKQEPIEGVSLGYSVDVANKNAAERHTVQYHEMTGSYAIYKDGWKASFPHDRSKRIPEREEKWHLYNLREDFNELNDLADKYPDKVKELAEVFDQEAWKYNVYPLKDKWEIANQSIYDGKTKITLYPESSFTSASAFRFGTSSYSISARAVIPSKGAEGVLLSFGNTLSGLSLYVKDKKLVFAYNSEGEVREVASDKPLPAGEITLKAEVIYGNDKKDKAVTLFINNEKAGILNLGTVATAASGYEGLEVGRDVGTTVTPAYKAPFTFTGELKDVVIEKL